MKARYQLSARLLVQGDYEQALEQLSVITQGGMPSLAERARRSILAILAILGPDHPLNQRYHTIQQQQAQ